MAELEIPAAVPPAAGRHALGRGPGVHGGAGTMVGFPGPAAQRPLCQITLEAQFENRLTEIRYLHESGQISAEEAHQRRRATYAFFEQAMIDLQHWLEATCC